MFQTQPLYSRIYLCGFCHGPLISDYMRAFNTDLTMVEYVCRNHEGATVCYSCSYYDSDDSLEIEATFIDINEYVHIKLDPIFNFIDLVINSKSNTKWIPLDHSWLNFTPEQMVLKAKKLLIFT